MRAFEWMGGILILLALAPMMTRPENALARRHDNVGRR